MTAGRPDDPAELEGGRQPGRHAPGGQAEQVEGAIDAVNQMMDVVDGFEAYVVYAAYRDRHGTRYRLNLLWIHSFAALMIAPLLSLTGRDGMSGPSFSFLRTLPGVPYSLSAMIGGGGLILGLGCIFRATRVKVVGLCGLLGFYLLLGGSFTVAPIRWIFHHTETKPPMYSPVIYAHLAVIMSVHIWGLIVRHRDERRAGQAMIEAMPETTGGNP